jgi:hypothetical protein
MATSSRMNPMRRTGNAQDEEGEWSLTSLEAMKVAGTSDGRRLTWQYNPSICASGSHDPELWAVPSRYLPASNSWMARSIPSSFGRKGDAPRTSGWMILGACNHLRKQARDGREAATHGKAVDCCHDFEVRCRQQEDRWAQK